MAEEAKRYIVTCKEEQMDANKAAGILGRSSSDMQDGVLTMATDKPVENSDIHHFQEIGTTVLVLAEKEVEELRHDDRVEEVVEDIEVEALGADDGELWDDSDSDAYEAGYQQALADMYGLENNEGNDSGGYEAGYQQVLADIHRSGNLGGSALSSRFPRFHFPSPFPRQPIRPLTPPPALRQPVGWNIQLVKAHQVWSRVTGRGVKVAVLDTGIDDNHPDLSVSGGVSMVRTVDSWDDDNGHGTHCAGIVGARRNDAGVIGVAPDCSLYAVKVLNGDGKANLSWILGGMGWAARQGMDVVSMSLGHEVASAHEKCLVSYHRAAQKLINAGCIMVAAAGNSGECSRPWVGQPARCHGFMAVAAVNRNSKIASFSSRGPGTLGPAAGVEISAPGVLVNSTYTGGGYIERSGTSMACPHVSGAAALLKELHPTWGPDRIRARLRSTARDLGAPRRDPTFGAGLLDCQRAVFG